MWKSSTKEKIESVVGNFMLKSTVCVCVCACVSPSGGGGHEKGGNEKGKCRPVGNFLQHIYTVTVTSTGAALSTPT